MNTRRRFLLNGAAAFAASPFASTWADEAKGKHRLKKAVKIGMVKGGGFGARFALLKKLGFEGVEMDSPGLNEDEKRDAKTAAEDNGITIHGVVDSTHWNVRHSDPDPAVRGRALGDLMTALRDAQFWGATTVLLVPGAVKTGQNENFDQVWERSTEQVKKAIPFAEKAKAKIAIEVVWNDFLTKPDDLVKYIDQFQSPWVGAYFDCSNMLKYGVASAEWIRKLGKKMLKFDFKGYSVKKAKELHDPWAGFKVPIGEGDEDWPEVLKALDEVGYIESVGWATAEVGGGGEKELRDIAERMDKVLGLVSV
jgi:hexulose-6-phosphate isomerase